MISQLSINKTGIAIELSTTCWFLPLHMGPVLEIARAHGSLWQFDLQMKTHVQDEIQTSGFRHSFFKASIQDGAPKIALSWFISGFVVDITIVNGGYFMVFPSFFPKIGASIGIYHVFRLPFSQGQVREGDFYLGGDFGEGEMAAQEAGESSDAFTQISYVFMYS